MSKKLTFEKAGVRMCQVARQIETSWDAMDVYSNLDEFVKHLFDVQMMPKRLRLIYHAAAFVILEYLYDEKFFEKDLDDLDKDVIKNVKQLREEIENNYGRLHQD